MQDRDVDRMWKSGYAFDLADEQLRADWLYHILRKLLLPTSADRAIGKVLIRKTTPIHGHAEVLVSS